jgi:hypothetical protein
VAIASGSTDEPSRFTGAYTYDTRRIFGLVAGWGKKSGLLTSGAVVGWSADQAGDAGFDDWLGAAAAWLVGAAVDGILGEEAAFEAEDGAVAGVEA